MTTPYNFVQTVTPSDATNIPIVGDACPIQGLYVGTGGDLTIVYPDGSTVQFLAVATGHILPIGGFVRVNSTGTDADDLLALYRV